VAEWRKIPEAGTVFGIRALVLFARIFGRTIAGWFLYIIAFYYALIRPVARRSSRDYLRRIGLPTGFWTVVRHIHTFAQVSLDRLFFLTGKIKPFEFEHNNHDGIVEAAKSGKGVLLLGAHLGSFEVMRCRAKEFDVPINVVVDFSNAERVNGVLHSLAPDMQTKLISLGDDPLAAMLQIRAAVARGELVAILGDRVPHGTNKSAQRVVTSTFLGEDASFPAGPWILAHSLRCPVYFVAGVYTQPRHYALHFEHIADEVHLERKDRAASLARYSQQYATMLEAYARSAPMNWFNFFDFWAVPSPSVEA
jgi:predicted LPLAT superfamily acyltransferase